MKNKLNILITGSNGFIGSNLYNLLSKDLSINLWTLKTKKNKSNSENQIKIDDLKSNFNIINDLKRIDCIIHLAALAHNNFSDEDIYDVNVKSVMKLSNQAAKANVKKFIFLSSIKVYGETSKDNQEFNEESETSPQTSYAKAKLEAERYLLQISQKTNLKISIIRSPLVYGKNAKANLKKLYYLIEKKIPIPKTSKSNLRSFIAIDNLLDFIVKCIYSSETSNQIFCVADEKDISTHNFFELIASSINRKIYYIHFNSKIIHFMFYIIGRKKMFDSIFSNHRVSIEKARLKLNWKPVITTEQAIKKYFTK
jgi:nucleoside-diphosphate-sugar epimerase